MKVREIDTPHGPARAHLARPEGTTSGAVILGHGAGGGVTAPDLQIATEVALDAGFAVALVEQPYRVAGRKAPAPAKQLDAAWIAVIGALANDELAGLSLVTGGRSSGARVACRTASEAEATAVLCLAFPVHPPGKGDDPSKSRMPELDAVEATVLVVQGESDPFGMPPPGPNREVVAIRGNHSLKSDRTALRQAIAAWLPGAVA